MGIWSGADRDAKIEIRRTTLCQRKERGGLVRKGVSLLVEEGK